jgi:hypothetical protein
MKIRKKKQREKLLKNIGSAGTSSKKKQKSTSVEFICRGCKQAEEIPREVVEGFDALDGGDSMDPPRFSCESCGDEMVPVYYESIHGIIYDYSELKRLG